MPIGTTATLNPPDWQQRHKTNEGDPWAALVFCIPCGRPWPFLLAASDAAMVPGLIGEARCVALTRDAVRGSVASSRGPRGRPHLGNDLAGMATGVPRIGQRATRGRVDIAGVKQITFRSAVSADDGPR